MPQRERDVDLLQRIGNRDQDALKQLYNTYAAHLNSFVRNYLSDPHEAADIVHEVMIEVWRKAGNFQGRSTVKSWIFSIARNKSIDRNRKAARSVTAEIDTEIADDAPDPERIVAAFQDAERVQICVEGLNTAQKTAIRLAFFEDFSYPEIAEIENCPVGTVKTRIMAAKSALLRCLSQFD